MTTEQLYQVTAPHLCAGIVMLGDLCVNAAPILIWAKGKQRRQLRAYFAKRGWTVTEAKL